MRSCHARRIFLRSLPALLLAPALGGCGQKGPLYFPPAPAQNAAKKRKKSGSAGTTSATQ